MREARAAWCEPGTPMLPRSLREHAHGEPAPRGVAAALGLTLTVNELDAGVWQRLPDGGADIDAGALRMVLSRAFGPRLAELRDERAIPPGVSGEHLRGAALRARARNVLHRAGLLENDTALATLTVGGLTELPGCGALTVLEILCVAEAVAASDPADLPGLNTLAPLLGELSAWALAEHGATTLGDLVDRVATGDVPDELAAHVEALRSLELSSLTAPEATARYDPVEEAARLAPRDTRSRLIFHRRLLAEDPATLAELGDALGVTRERVRQLERRLREDFTDRLAGPLARLAADAGRELGAALRQGAPPEEASRLIGVLRTAGWGDAAWPLTRFLAGPYVRRRGWWVREDRLARLQALPDELLAGCDERGLADPARVHDHLERAGIRSRWQREWLEEHTALRHLGDVYARWDGPVADKLVRVLAVRGTPATTQELLREAGLPHTPRSARHQLLDDPRVVRIDRAGRFALTEWGHEEYGGIVAAIEAELDRRGEPLSIDELCRSISARFATSPYSVRAFAGAPVFVAEAGSLRRRRDDEPFDVGTEVHAVAGAFDYGERVVLRLPVTRDTLRGSGKPLPQRLGMRLGVPPGHRRHFTDATSDVVVSWARRNFTPGIGSLRAHCEAHGAQLGDHLVVVLRDDGVADVRHVSQRVRADARHHLRRSVGLPIDADEATIVRELAGALGTKADHAAVAKALRSRDEHDLAEALER